MRTSLKPRECSINIGHYQGWDLGKVNEIFALGTEFKKVSKDSAIKRTVECHTFTNQNKCKKDP